MKITKDMKVGDIYLNPLAEDLWILRKDYIEDYDNEQWVLSLVHTDYVVEYAEVDKFIKLGNIYEVFERIDKVLEYIDSPSFTEFKPNIRNLQRLMTIQCDLKKILIKEK